jgi:hypothetical protein
MNSEFIARIPHTSVVYQTPELPLGNFQILVLKVLSMLQGLSATPQTVSIVEDWLDHDGLEFPEGVLPLSYLFSLASTPRSIFEGTPKEDFVYLRAEVEGGTWTLRMRTSWTDDDREQIGSFDLVVSDDLTSTLEVALESELSHHDIIRRERAG